MMMGDESKRASVTPDRKVINAMVHARNMSSQQQAWVLAKPASNLTARQAPVKASPMRPKDPATTVIDLSNRGPAEDECASTTSSAARERIRKLKSDNMKLY